MNFFEALMQSFEDAADIMLAAPVRKPSTRAPAKPKVISPTKRKRSGAAKRRG